MINRAGPGTGYIRTFRNYSGWLGEYPENVDFITVFGGMNDFETETGSFGDTDGATVYGALYAYYSELIRKYPDTPIGVITSTPRIYRCGEDGVYAGHINAVIETAGHFSLPVLDLYRQSGIRPRHSGDMERFFACEANPEGDGVHFNEEGQRHIAVLIGVFITDYLRPRG